MRNTMSDLIILVCCFWIYRHSLEDHSFAKRVFAPVSSLSCVLSMNSTMSDLIILICEFSACCFLINSSTQLKKPTVLPNELVGQSVYLAVHWAQVAQCPIWLFSSVNFQPPRMHQAHPRWMMWMNRPWPWCGRSLRMMVARRSRVTSSSTRRFLPTAGRPTMTRLSRTPWPQVRTLPAWNALGFSIDFHAFGLRPWPLGFFWLPRRFFFPETGTPKSEVPLGCRRKNQILALWSL